MKALSLFTSETRLPDGVTFVLQHAFWLLGLGLTPLILSPGVLFGDGATAMQDTTALRALLVPVVVVFGCLTFFASSSATRKEVLDWGRNQTRWILPLLGLIAWLLIATPLGNSGIAVPAIGSPVRYDGTGIQAMWFLLVLVGALMARFGTVSPKSILSYAILSAAVTSAGVLLQGLGIDPLTRISQSGFEVRMPAGAFGHGALASTYIGLVVVMLITWIPREQVRVGHVLVFLLLGAGMAAAGGRAGIVASAAITMLALARVWTDRVVRVRTLALILVIVVGAASAYVYVPRAQRQAASASSALFGTDSSLNNRFPAWRGAFSLLQDNPLFGIGSDGFAHSVWDHLSESDTAQLLRAQFGTRLSHLSLAGGDYTIAGNLVVFLDETGALSIRQLGWDKAHNYLLDLGLAAGLPAIAFFILFVMATLATLLRSPSPTQQGIGNSLLVFLLYGTVWFGMIALDPVFWLFIGSGLGLAGRSKLEPRVARSSAT